MAGIPSGTGIAMSGDQVVIEDNIITGNNTGGAIITSGDFVTEVAGDRARTRTPMKSRSATM